MFKILPSADTSGTKPNIREVCHKNNLFFSLRRTLGFITALKRMNYNLLSSSLWEELVFGLIRLSSGKKSSKSQEYLNKQRTNTTINTEISCLYQVNFNICVVSYFKMIRFRVHRRVSFEIAFTLL